MAYSCFSLLKKEMVFFGSILYKCIKFEEQHPVFQLNPPTEEGYRQMTPLERDAFHLVSVIVN